ncbi:MAG: STAS domain-containing protein [Deltaproteobacteria bacterium]|nr:STAS domain-containing protein [Deltaproteobacteria bacterium]MBW2112365.1 STAS domain-containing protein [Deltaproteobacteria bacterium]MBW2352739.1 STAS domain-containing protein [Deltaproteobacteria bacterium]
MKITDNGKQKGFLVIGVEGRMDAVTTPEFEQTLGDRIDEGETRLIVDLSALEYISSAGLRGILTGVKKVNAKGGEMIFTGLRDAVREVFEISGFSTIIPTHESVEAALKKI